MSQFHDQFRQWMYWCELWTEQVCVGEIWCNAGKQIWGHTEIPVYFIKLQSLAWEENNKTEFDCKKQKLTARLYGKLQSTPCYFTWDGEWNFECKLHQHAGQSQPWNYCVRAAESQLAFTTIVENVRKRSPVYSTVENCEDRLCGETLRFLSNSKRILGNFWH